MSNTPAAFAYPISSAFPTASAEVSNSQAVGSSSTTQTTVPQTRQAAEEARKDRTLAEFMLMLDEYEPLVCVLRLIKIFDEIFVVCSRYQLR